MQNKIYSFVKPENPTVMEAYSMLAGNIYTSFEPKKVKSLVVTGIEPKVGKTSVATNLAITLASWGKRTVLINADMRKQTDKKQINSNDENGTYQYLQGISRLENVLCTTNIENLTYIPNGSTSENPMGLLCSGNLEELISKAGQNFEYIVFDTPALNCVSDAAIIAAKVDAALLVSHMGRSKMHALMHAKEELNRTNSNLLGVVINRVNKADYRRYFGAYKYFLKMKRRIVKEKKTNEVSTAIQI